MLHHPRLFHSNLVKYSLSISIFFYFNISAFTRRIKLYVCVCVCVGTFNCEHCGRTCTSKIGMFAHRRSCNPSSTTVCQPRAATSSDVTSTASSTTVLTCSNCGRTCSSKIEMFAHQRMCHRWDSSKTTTQSVCVCVVNTVNLSWPKLLHFCVQRRTSTSEHHCVM